MKKLILFYFLALIVSLQASAQWVESGSLKNISWEYCFAAPAPPISNTISGDNLTIVSTPTTSNVLPSPTSGEVKIMTNTEAGTGRSSYTLNGTCEAANSLTIVSTSGGAPSTTIPSKFTVSQFQDASKVMSAHFNITFNNTSENITGTWYIFIGSQTGNVVFTSNSASPAVGASTTSADARAFACIRVKKSAKGGKYQLAVRKENPPSDTWPKTYNYGLTGQYINDVFETGENAKIDIYCNDETGERSYSHNGGTPIILEGRKFDIYVNNVKLGTYDRSTYNGGIIYGIASLNGLCIMSREPATSNVGNDNSASVTISNLKIVHLATPTTTPVTLTGFNGNATNTGIALKWQTASEQKNSHFVLNRSINGKDFSYLTRVEGQGTTNNVSNYSYTDKNPSAGTNYYQLEQIDTDGAKTIIEKVVAVKYGVSGEPFTVSKVSSNQLKAFVSSEKDEDAELSITDISGKVIYKTTRALKQGNNQIDLFVPSAKPGVYVATLKGTAETKSVKFVL